MKRILILENVERDVARMKEHLLREARNLGLEIDIVSVTTATQAHEVLLLQVVDLISIGTVFTGMGISRNESISLDFIKRLGTFRYAGETVFYSRNEDDVAEAELMTVSGKEVHARLKMTFDCEEEGWLSIPAWAKLCLSLLNT